MRSFSFFFLFILVSIGINAQNCTNAVSNTIFQQQYALVAAQNSDQNKLNTAIAFSAINCLSSNQVQLIAGLFSNDSYRLEFCKLSYTNIVDKPNFYPVYDSFSTFSAAFQLHDYIALFNTPLPTTPTIPDPKPAVPPVGISFPGYDYPSYEGYNGPSGCSTPISETDFKLLAQSVNTYTTDDEKMAQAAILLKDKCISMAQAMKLASLFQMEVKALAFLKNQFGGVYDQNNYPAVTQCFGHLPYQNDWNLFCSGYLTPPAPVVTCDVDEAKFKTMLKNIDNANFAKDQLNVVNNLNKHHCFYTAQVKRILDEFSFPADKLSAAKTLYEKCLDKEKYYTLRKEFTFPVYQEEFDQLIK
ncbi:MAG: DUF4476 domain-containing protein [Flavobacteriales bacterium]|nr:DUF4476 domain-containing protein [Flavobacteriales bacterium]